MAQTAEAEATFENKFKAVVWPGRYQIATAVPSCFVKRFLVDGVTQSANSFEIGNGTAASIDVLLSSAVASLDGQVSGVRDRLSEGSTLLLEKEREPDLSMEQVAGADGKFQWNSLEPGKYRLYAFEDFDREEWGNPRLAELLPPKSLEFQNQRRRASAGRRAAHFGCGVPAGMGEVGILTRMPDSCCNSRVRSLACPATS
jgi:hypothetical protein